MDYNSQIQYSTPPVNGPVVSASGFSLNDPSTDGDFENSIMAKTEDIPNEDGLGIQQSGDLQNDFTLITNGQLLMDETGNVVGQLSEDGKSYTLYSAIEPQTFVNGMETCAQEVNELPYQLQNDDLAEQQGQENQILNENVKEEGENSAMDEFGIMNESDLSNTASFHQKGIEMQPVETSMVMDFKADVNDTNDSIINEDTQAPPPALTQATLVPVAMSQAPVTQTTLSDQHSVTSPRLGSKANPIQIIQEGNQYTSVQQLAPEQMKNILKFIQSQRLPNTTKNMQTIVYYHGNRKITYQPVLANTAAAPQPGKAVATPAYPGRKRGRKRKSEALKKEEEERKIAAAKMEEHKKKKLKTRSGRVSKPPKHMVEEYKHIPLKEWDEDYDDSDGGYSDYKDASSDELQTESPVSKRERKNKKEDETAIEQAYDMLQPRKFRCGVCTKSYIGRSGLERHLKNNPSHSVEILPLIKSEQFQDADQDASRESSMLEQPTESSVAHTKPSPASKQRKRYGYNSRRKKLLELINRCSDEVVLDAVIPRLSEMTSLFELLVIKCALSNGSKLIRFEQMFQEVTDLQTMLQEAVEKTVILPGDEESLNAEEPQVNVSPELESFLGIKSGQYAFDTFVPTTELLTKFMTDQGLLDTAQEEQESHVDETTMEGSLFRKSEPKDDMEYDDDDDTNSCSNPGKFNPECSQSVEEASMEEQLEEQPEKRAFKSISESKDQLTETGAFKSITDSKDQLAEAGDDFYDSSTSVSKETLSTEQLGNDNDEALLSPLEENLTEDQKSLSGVVGESLEEMQLKNEEVPDDEAAEESLAQGKTEESKVPDDVATRDEEEAEEENDEAAQTHDLPAEETESENKVVPLDHIAPGTSLLLAGNKLEQVGSKPVLVPINSSSPSQSSTLTLSLPVSSPVKTIPLQLQPQKFTLKASLPATGVSAAAKTPASTPTRSLLRNFISSTPPVKPARPPQVTIRTRAAAQSTLRIIRQAVPAPRPPPPQPARTTTVAVTKNPNGTLAVQILGEQHLPTEAIKNVLAKFPTSSLQVGVQQILSLSQDK